MSNTKKANYPISGKVMLTITLLLNILLHPSVLADVKYLNTGAVYAMTNDLYDNVVLIYDQNVNGTLKLTGKIATGGKGGIGFPAEPNDALGSANPLILSKDKKWLFAVNAGSNEISVFRTERRAATRFNKAINKLVLVDKVNSGGEFPVSITYDRGLLYVLNAGGDANITGFYMTHEGRLKPLFRSTRTLNSGGGNPPFFLDSPAQVQFGPRGKMIVVTEKGSNEIHVFPLSYYGYPSLKPVSTISNGFTPFGFTFDRRGNLLVCEAFGTATNPPLPPTGAAGAVSSYRITYDGSLQIISASVGNFQTATCWLAYSKGFAYATNNASHTITGYRAYDNGKLQLLDTDGVTAETGIAPIDLGISSDGRFLYNVNAASGTISMFQINPWNGSLKSLGEVSGLPASTQTSGAVGIAVR